MSDNNFSDPQFARLLEDFQTYCHSESLLLGELEQPPLFFQAQPVQALIDFGRDNPSCLPLILSTLGRLLAEKEGVSCFRGSLTGYLVGLYGENGISSPETDLALADFYLYSLELNSEYLWLACQYLGIEPEQLTAKTGADEAATAKRQELVQRIKILPPDLAAFHNTRAMQAWCALSPLSFGMMSRLAASRELRDYFRQHDENGRLLGMCSLLSEWHEAVGFIPYMLDLEEEATGLVLAPAAQKGVEVKISQLDSNNLFFTLLQIELYHKNLLNSLGGLPFNYQPVIEKIAKHEPLPAEEWPEHLYEQGYLGYYTWQALRPDGSFDEWQPVWGEGVWSEIPRLQGQTLILVGPPQIQRSWGEAFVAGTHKNLRPQVEILRELPREEVQQWLAAIREANGSEGQPG